MEGEESSLLGNKPMTATSAGGRNLMKNFIIMATCFGFSHGSVTVALAYATSVFDLRLGSFATGFLYSAYTLSSLLLATPIVEAVGPRQALLVSLGCYFIYMICFVVASGLSVETDLALQWVLVISGSLIGGTVSGLGWVAQGTYYGISAALYAQEEGVPLSAANDRLAGYFGAIYVGLQCLLFLSSSLLLEFTSFNDDDLFIVYAAIALGSFVAMALLLDELNHKEEEEGEGGVVGNALADGADDEGGGGGGGGVGERRVETEGGSSSSVGKKQKKKGSWLAHATSAVELTFTHRRAQLLVPLGVVFGFTATFVSSYVNDKTVSDQIGTFAVGYFGVIQTGTIALLSVPFSTLASVAGKGTCLGIGSLAYAALAVAYMCADNSQLGHWRFMAPLFVAYGVGRLTFETTTKAVFADFFTGLDRTPGFANLNFVAGLSATIYSFVISEASRVDLAVMVLVPAVLMLPGFYFARAVPSEM